MFGEIASAVGLLAAGYGFGRWQESRRRREATDALIAKRLAAVLGSLRISGIAVEPHQIRPGAQLCIRFDIESSLTRPFDAWLGASLVDAFGQERFDTSQDKTVVLQAGRQTYTRALTVPPGTPPGPSRLVVAVYLGRCASPQESIRLARTEHDPPVVVTETAG